MKDQMRLIVFVILFFLLSCNHQKVPNRKHNKPVSKTEITKINRYLIEKDEQVIKKYAERRGWDLKKRPSGLWYMIYEKGNGQHIENGDKVIIDYTIELLDGTV